jgi:hypothetical protein
MKYMLLIFGEEGGWETLSEPQQRQIMEETRQHVEQLKAGGQYVISAPLHSTSMATCVRIREGKRLVTDGPFVETKEQLGGFYLIEAKDLDEAIDIASRQPGVRWEWGTVEIRPVQELGACRGQGGTTGK